MNPLAILDIGSKILDKVLPDPEKKAEAQRELLKLQQAGSLDSVNAQLSAIIAEANSKDPFTSRARPSFLYVMYVMILAAIPMGALHAFYPEVAAGIATGMKSWLDAIPEEMWYLFGTGYLGYTGARTYDKRKRQ